MSSVFVLLVALVAPSGNPILARVPELQDTARKSNCGALGCGSGTMTLVTSRGEVAFDTGLDSIQVFGPHAKASDLLALLESRAESNRSWTGGPMSGEVADLCFVALHTLADAPEPLAIPVMAELTQDSHEMISQWAEFSLTKLVKTDAQWQPAVSKAMTAARSAASQRRTQQRMGIGAVVVIAFLILGTVAYQRSRLRGSQQTA